MCINKGDRGVHDPLEKIGAAIVVDPRINGLGVQALQRINRPPA